EIGIDFRRDALELTERLDLFQPSVEIARVGAARNRFGLGFLALWLALGRAHRDAHVHGRLRLVLFPIERSLARFDVKCIRGGAEWGEGGGKKRPGAAGGAGLVGTPGVLRGPAIALSRPRGWASVLSSRRWSSLKLITSG